MDTFPGPTACPRNCAGLVVPGGEQAHFAWHDQQQANTAALQAQVAALKAQLGIKV